MNWKTKESRRLVDAVLSLKTPDEAQRFLRDLLTEEEIVEFANRLKTAELLAAGVPYTRIEAATGMSSTTVARVAKWLNGPEGGYRRVIARLHHGHSFQAGRGLP